MTAISDSLTSTFSKTLSGLRNTIKPGRAGYLLLFIMGGMLLIGDACADYAFEVDSSLGGADSFWVVRGAQGAARIDGTQAHLGKSSLLLDTQTSTQKWVAVEHLLVATNTNPRLFKVSAWFLASRLDGGVSGLMVEYQPLNAARPKRFTTFAKRLEIGSEWQRREITAFIPAGAANVRISAALGATGKIWVDDVTVEDIDLDQNPPKLAPAAAQYLGRVLSILKENALMANHIDWPAMGKIAHWMAVEATTPADTYEAVEFLVAEMGDRHTHFVRSSQAASGTAATILDWTATMQPDFRESIAYFKLPGFVGNDVDAMSKYVAAAWKVIDQGVANRTCGWIVDLQSNGGGNSNAMLAALTPFLGTGTVATLIRPMEVLPVQASASFLAYVAEQTGTPLPQVPARGRLGVVLGKKTLSSGELTAIALSSLRDAQSFGVATGGLTTGVRPFILEDGASLNVATHRMANTAGKEYLTGVVPDVEVLDEKEILGKVRKWVAEKPCETASKASTEVFNSQAHGTNTKAPGSP